MIIRFSCFINVNVYLSISLQKEQLVNSFLLTDLLKPSKTFRKKYTLNGKVCSRDKFFPLIVDPIEMGSKTDNVSVSTHEHQSVYPVTFNGLDLRVQLTQKKTYATKKDRLEDSSTEKNFSLS